MKKGKVLSYILSKKYYLALLGCLLIIAVSLSVILSGDKNSEELANLNEEVINEISNEGSDESYDANVIIDDSPDIIVDEPYQEVTISRELVPEENYQADNIEMTQDDIGESEDEAIQEDEEIDESSEDGEVLVEEEEIAQEEIEIIPVISVEQPNITFKAENGIMMPLEGEVILDFSSTIPVYFKTLKQYQTNEGMLIGCEEGAEVKAVADGIVEKIEVDEKRGNVITIYHGNGYKSFYGQLGDDVNVREGDIIDKGRIIGYVTQPTNYYQLEGTHLYLAIVEDGVAIDPKELVK